VAFAVRSRVTALAPHAFLEDAIGCFRAPRPAPALPLRFGIDLGTATVVLTAVDALERPVYWDFAPCAAVRDGVVVDFAGAIREVRALKARAEPLLGCALETAATAYPPGVAAAEARACRYVLEQSDVRCRVLVDEVSAAQALIAIDDGAVVDVGGGSTGVGVFRAGHLVTLSDAAGGGHHLDLIIAGALHIPIEEAERVKRTRAIDVADIVRPGIERIAESIRRQIGAEPVATVHLVGGALMLPGAAGIVARYLGVTTVGYPHAELITPFGMALCDG
jgi:ethanolamine utilization protein EutJ